MTFWARTAIAALALTALAGCAQQVPGTPQANEPARLAHIACARSVNDAVGSVKTFLTGVEAFANQPLDAAPLRAMRAACNNEFVPAYSDFLVRVRHEYTPSTVMGRIGQNTFMTGMCRNDSPVGVKVDQLSEAAQKACRGT